MSVFSAASVWMACIALVLFGLVGGGTRLDIAMGSVMLAGLGFLGSALGRNGTLISEALGSGATMPWIGGMFAVTYGLTSLTWLEGSRDPLFAIISPQAIPRGMLIAGVGFLSLLAGYILALANRSSLHVSVKRALLGPTKPPTLLAAWALFVVGLFAAGLLLQQRNFGYLQDVEAALSNPSSVTQLLNLLTQFAVYALALTAYGSRKWGGTPWVASTSVMYATLIMLGLLAGMKEQLVVATLALLLGRAYAKSRIRPTTIVVVSLLLLSVVVPVVTAYRQIVAVDGQRLSPMEVVTNVGRTTSGTSALLAGSNSAIDPFLSRMTRISDVAVIAQKTPAVIPHRSTHELLAAPSLGIVPRAVWPGKPVLSTGLDFSREYYSLPATVRTSTAVTPYGDLYRHGGMFPLVVGSLLLGLLIGILDRARLGPHDPRWLFLTLSMFAIVVKQEMDYISMVAALPGTLIFVAIASRFSATFSNAADPG